MSSADASASTPATSNDRTFVYPTIDDHSTIEVGLRIFEQRREGDGTFAPKREDLPGQRVEWAKSEKFKVAPKVRAIPAEYLTGRSEGIVPIPETYEGVPVREIFDTDQGFIMVKIVSAQKDGYFINPCRYKGFDFTDVYEYDRVQPQRENGDYVYSLPFHKLVRSDRALTKDEKKKGCKHEVFFFLVRIQGAKGAEKLRATLKVDRVSITRGKDHFRVIIERHYDHVDDHDRLVPVPIAHIGRVSEQVEALDGLPLTKVFARYLEHLGS